MWSVWLVFCDCGFHSVCLLMDKDKSPMETSWWERLWEKLVLVLMGGARLSKSLIQFSVDGWGCVPFLLFDLRPNYGGGNKHNGDFLQKVQCIYCYTQCSQPCHHWPTPPLETPGHSWLSLNQSLMGSLLLSPGSWCIQDFVCSFQESVSPVLCYLWWLCGRVNGNLFQDGLCHTQELDM